MKQRHGPEDGTVTSAFKVAAATGLARIVALGREVVAARYFGVTATMSAFTVAFQIPNLMRALFADAALQGAVVPELGDLLEHKKRTEAIQTISALAAIVVLGLGVASMLFLAIADPVMRVIAPGLAAHGASTGHLAANLARIMFPVVLLITLSGVAAGALNAFNEFTIPAIAPALWNGVIVIALLGGVPHTSSGHRIYVYALAVLAGSVVQLILPLPRLRALGVSLVRPKLRGNDHLKRILRNMLPVTVALGVMNFSLLLDSLFGSLISPSAPAAIDKAFRLWQLPQGIFSVAIATVMFPALIRSAVKNDLPAVRERTISGTRVIAFLMLPSAVMLGALAEPVVHVVYQRGVFNSAATAMTATALRWWAVSLPFAGVSSFLWRVLFSLNERRVALRLTVANIGVNALVSGLLYGPLGITGDVVGTVSGTVVMTVLQVILVRRRLEGPTPSPLAGAALGRMVVAALVAGGASYALFAATRPAQAASTLSWTGSLAVAAILGCCVYGLMVWALRVPEARMAALRVRQLVAGTRHAARASLPIPDLGSET